MAARPRKAGDEPAPDRIVSSSDDNGEGAGRLLGGEGVGCASGQDDIDFERNQLGRKSGEPLELPLGVSHFNHDVAAFDVTEVTQSLTEGLWQVGTSGQVANQVAYPGDLDRLLGLGGERHREDAPTHKGDERSPVYHRTISSALVKRLCGIVRPSALAVLRLTTNSNLVGC